MASADRGLTQLLSYGELYYLWERQQWAVQDLDFTQDRIDWHERIPPEERYQRMAGLSSFFIGEQRVAAELGPMMRAARGGDARVPLHPDRRRGPARVLRPLLLGGGRPRARRLGERLEETSVHLNKNFGGLFDQMLAGRVDRLAEQPEDLETLVEAVTLYHMIIEGMLALTGQHFIIEYNESRARCPASWRASTTWPATSTATWPSAPPSCATWPSATGTATPSSARWWRRPGSRRRATPPWAEEGEDTSSAYTLGETRAFAMKALERRLKVIGLTPAASQNIRPPRGTSDDGPQQDHAALLVRHAQHQHLRLNGPICRGGKFTTPTTRRPSSSSRE